MIIGYLDPQGTSLLDLRFSARRMFCQKRGAYMQQAADKRGRSCWQHLTGSVTQRVGP